MRRPRRRVVALVGVGLLVLALVLAGTAVALRLLEDDAGPSAAPAGAPRPVVDGNRLVDSRSGRTWVPRGVTWSSFETACAQGWGLSALDAATGSEPGDPTPYAAQADALRSWGIDTVRLPLNQDCWLGTRDAPVGDGRTERTSIDYREAVGTFVDALNTAGIVVVLDLATRKREDTPEVEVLTSPDTDSLTFWRLVAGEYADDPSVLFDALDSPAVRAQGSGDARSSAWACWRDGGCDAAESPAETAGMQDVVDTIRGAGAEQPVLLSGLDEGRDLGLWAEFAPTDDQLVAAFHADETGDCSTRACWDDVLTRLAEEVPVLTSDLRADRPTGSALVGDHLAWAQERQVGALLWVWAARTGDPSALVRDLGGSPTPWGRQARAWFLDGTLPGRPPAQEDRTTGPEDPSETPDQ